MAPIDIKFKGQGSNCLDIGNFIACSIFWDPLARQTSSLVDIYMYPWRSRWSQLIFRSWGQRSKVKLLWTLKSILYSLLIIPRTLCLLLSTLWKSFSCSILPHWSEAYCLHISDIIYNNNSNHVFFSITPATAKITLSHGFLVFFM